MSKVQELKAKMQTMTEARTTEQLFSDLAELETRKVVGTMGMRNLPTAEERMVEALIADTIEARHGLESAMEAIFTEDYAGTYTDALMLAYVAVGN